MNIKKIVAGFSATAMALSAMAVMSISAVEVNQKEEVISYDLTERGWRNMYSGYIQQTFTTPPFKKEGIYEFGAEFELTISGASALTGKTLTQTFKPQFSRSIEASPGDFQPLYKLRIVHSSQHPAYEGDLDLDKWVTVDSDHPMTVTMKRPQVRSGFRNGYEKYYDFVGEYYINKEKAEEAEVNNMTVYDNNANIVLKFIYNVDTGSQINWNIDDETVFPFYTKASYDIDLYEKYLGAIKLDNAPIDLANMFLLSPEDKALTDFNSIKSNLGYAVTNAIGNKKGAKIRLTFAPPEPELGLIEGIEGPSLDYGETEAKIKDLALAAGRGSVLNGDSNIIYPVQQASYVKDNVAEFDWDSMVTNTGLAINSIGLIDNVFLGHKSMLEEDKSKHNFGGLKLEKVEVVIPAKTFDDLSAGEGITEIENNI